MNILLIYLNFKDMNLSKMIFAILFLFSFTACELDDLVNPVGDNNGTTPLNTDLGIEAVPSSLGNKYTKHFDRYTKVVAPNGKAIHIVAQNKITDEQIVRCRSILEHYLTNLEGATYGNKGAIADKMADNNAILTLLNGRDDGNNRVRVAGQALYEEEIQVEGNSWYVNQEYENHRDAAFEEILHLVHDYGIGVDGRNSNPGAAPDFQKAIRAAQVNALNNNVWGIGSADWIKELDRENSLSQEYLAALVDSYYGLWGAWNGDAGMWGLYVAKTRADIAIKDPMGQAIMDGQFFHPYLTYNARIDANFTGTFSLKFDATIPYTHHAQYLKDITLLGNNAINVAVNSWDNDITGNEGTNQVIFSGNQSEYQIETNDETTVVIDNIANRDGKNVLRAVEQLKFSDGIVDL